MTNISKPLRLRATSGKYAKSTYAIHAIVAGPFVFDALYYLITAFASK